MASNKQRFIFVLVGSIISMIIIICTSSIHHKLDPKRLFVSISGNVPTTGTVKESFRLIQKTVKVQEKNPTSEDEAKVPQTEPIPEEKNINTIQDERHEILDRNCIDLGMKKPIPRDPVGLSRVVQFRRLLYSDKHKLIVCVIPKCGSSSMKKVLLAVEEKVKEANPQDVEPGIVHDLADKEFDLSHFRNASEITRRLDSYLKLIIVRDPMYRLVSAYRNKLGNRYPWNKDFQDKSEKIHARYSNQSDNMLATFQEFLLHLTESDPSSFDEHWALYHKICYPCVIPYDFIAHMETIEKDMNHVLERVGITNVTFPHNYDASKQTDAEKVLEYFKNVPKDLVERVYHEYAIDHKLFGFPPSITRR